MTPTKHIRKLDDPTPTIASSSSSVSSSPQRSSHIHEVEDSNSSLRPTRRKTNCSSCGGVQTTTWHLNGRGGSICDTCHQSVIELHQEAERMIKRTRKSKLALPASQIDFSQDSTNISDPIETKKGRSISQKVDTAQNDSSLSKVGKNRTKTLSQTDSESQDGILEIVECIEESQDSEEEFLIL